jgi:hypothetical protein
MHQCLNGRMVPAVGRAIRVSSLAGLVSSFAGLPVLRDRTKVGDAPGTLVGLVRLASS